MNDRSQEPENHQKTDKDDYNPSVGRRRIITITVIIAVLVVGFSSLWWFLAEQTKSRMDAALEKAQDGGATILCEDRAITGFPFRLGVKCSSTIVSLHKLYTQVSAGELRTAAQLYNPGFAVAELDAPLKITSATGTPLLARWDVARGSARVGLGGLQTASMRFSNPVLGENDTGDLGQVFASSDWLEFHGRQGEGADTIDVAVRAANLDLDRLTDVTIPGLSGEANLSLDGLSAWQASGMALRQYLEANGMSGRVVNLEVSPASGGTLYVSGPFSIDPNGILSGNFKLLVRDATALAGTITKAAPRYEEEISNAVRFIGVLPSEAIETGRDDTPSVNAKRMELTIRNGNMFLGLIPLGQVPPLY